MVRISIEGDLGGGKGVLAMKLIKEWEFPKPLISNIHLNIPHEFLSDRDCVLFLKSNFDKPQNIYNKFHDKLWFIDEIYNLLEARGSAGNAINQVVTSFIMMAGKINLDIIYTSQIQESQVDLRLRETSDIKYTCCAIREPLPGEDPRARKIKGKVTIWAEGEEKMGLMGKLKLIEIFDPSPYYSMYQTDELVFCDRIKLAQDLKNGNTR